MKPVVSDASYFLNKGSDNWPWTLRGHRGWAEISKAFTFVEVHACNTGNHETKNIQSCRKNEFPNDNHLFQHHQRNLQIPMAASSHVTMHCSKARYKFAMNQPGLRIQRLPVTQTATANWRSGSVSGIVALNKRNETEQITDCLTHMVHSDALLTTMLQIWPFPLLDFILRTY